MKYFVIGFIIIALAYSLINIFKKFFGKDEILEDWTIIQYLLFIVLLTELIIIAAL